MVFRRSPYERPFFRDMVARLTAAIAALVLLWAFSSCAEDRLLKHPISGNAALGLPVKDGACFEVVDRAAFSLGYDDEHEQSAWVCYRLTRDEVVSANVSRTEDFRPDPEISSGSAELVDYKGSGYDRGHLAPAADMAWSVESMSQSFFLSNICPQEPGFNRGIWKHLEELVRAWATQNEEVFVVTGPILTEDLKTIGPNAVSVPDFCYKIILDYYGDEKKGIAFLLPNRSSQRPLTEYVKTIDDIELVTGLDFFHKLPDSEEEKLESSAAYWLWDKGGIAAMPLSLPIAGNGSPSIAADKDHLQFDENRSETYWLTISSGVRHNPTCRWYKNSKGRFCSGTEGRACKLCGG